MGLGLPSRWVTGVLLMVWRCHAVSEVQKALGLGLMGTGLVHQAFPAARGVKVYAVVESRLVDLPHGSAGFGTMQQWQQPF